MDELISEAAKEITKEVAGCGCCGGMDWGEAESWLRAYLENFAKKVKET
jgi:hypothetical protein